MSEEFGDEYKSGLLIVYIAMAMSGGFMGFIGGVLLGWFLWG